MAETTELEETIDERQCMYAVDFGAPVPDSRFIKLLNLSVLWPGGFLGEIERPLKAARGRVLADGPCGCSRTVDEDAGVVRERLAVKLTVSSGLSNPGMPGSVVALSQNRSGSSVTGTLGMRTVPHRGDPAEYWEKSASRPFLPSGFGYELVCLEGPTGGRGLEIFNYLCPAEVRDEAALYRRVLHHGALLVDAFLTGEQEGPAPRPGPTYAPLIALPAATWGDAGCHVVPAGARTYSTGKAFEYVVVSQVGARDFTWLLARGLAGALREAVTAYCTRLVAAGACALSDPARPAVISAAEMADALAGLPNRGVDARLHSAILFWAAAAGGGEAAEGLIACEPTPPAGAPNDEGGFYLHPSDPRRPDVTVTQAVGTESVTVGTDGADVRTPGRHPLVRCASIGCARTVRALLALPTGHFWGVASNGPVVAAALSQAAMFDHDEVVALLGDRVSSLAALTKAGVPLIADSALGATPYRPVICAYHPPPDRRAAKGFFAVAALFERLGATAADVRSALGGTPVLFAAQGPDRLRVLSWAVRTCRADWNLAAPDARDTRSANLLFLAVAAGQPASVHHLLRLGADPTAPGHANGPAPAEAALRGDPLVLAGFVAYAALRAYSRADADASFLADWSTADAALPPLPPLDPRYGAEWFWRTFFPGGSRSSLVSLVLAAVVSSCGGGTAELAAIGEVRETGSSAKLLSLHYLLAELGASYTLPASEVGDIGSLIAEMAEQDGAPLMHYLLEHTDWAAGASPAFMFACRSGRAWVAEVLIRRGAITSADVLRKTGDATPFHKACGSGCRRLVGILSEFVRNDPALHVVLNGDAGGFPYTPLAMVTGYLSDEPREEDEADRALLVSDLLALGSHVDVVLPAGDTCLSNFCYNANRPTLACAEALIRSGADVNATNASEEGQTCLMYAAAANHLGLVQLLLRHGADPALRTTSGQTAADFTSSLRVRGVLEGTPPGGKALKRKRPTETDR